MGIRKNSGISENNQNHYYATEEALLELGKCLGKAVSKKTKEVTKAIDYLQYSVEPSPTLTVRCREVTKNMLDERPTKPTKSDPHQRVMLPRRVKKVDRYVVYLTAAGMLSATSNRYAAKFAIGSSDTPRSDRRLFREPLELVYFKPIAAPFVPQLLVLLVNSIENSCYISKSWEKIFQPLTEHYAEGREALVELVHSYHDQEALKNTVRRLSLPVRIVTVRLFLSELNIKPLYFKRQQLEELTHTPLRDLYMRPNVGVRAIVEHAALSNSGVDTDTLSFLMLHLLHVRECVLNPLEGKIKLASIYGKLLITYVHRPELCGLDYGDGKTVDSALMEVILEICDCHFWDHLSGLKMKSAFARSLYRGGLKSPARKLRGIESFGIGRHRKLGLEWTASLGSSGAASSATETTDDISDQSRSRPSNDESSDPTLLQSATIGRLSQGPAVQDIFTFQSRNFGGRGKFSSEKCQPTSRVQLFGWPGWQSKRSRKPRDFSEFTFNPLRPTSEILDDLMYYRIHSQQENLFEKKHEPSSSRSDRMP
ncbi:unnamed protein product [Calicophoron daubneyi]|uniref:Uncharacterized protein n=1 Tax=Calicophoron daubneyi TaxID=300641 RepID=A0AAV2TCN2_CALDB